LSAVRDESFTLFQDRGFRKHSSGISFGTAVLKWLSFSADYSKGSDVNFFPAAGINPFLANATAARVSFTVKPASQLSLEQTYIFNRLGTLSEHSIWSPKHIKHFRTPFRTLTRRECAASHQERWRYRA
jgi:hypothetical protein